MKPRGIAAGKQPVGFDAIEFAVEQIAAGQPVVAVDDEDRENEGDLIFAAELATPELLAFTIRYSSGVVCVPLTGHDCDRLALPPMRRLNEDREGAAYTVSVDATDIPDTGISAADRAHTIRVLAGADTEPGDLTRPGHVFPVRCECSNYLARSGRDKWRCIRTYVQVTVGSMAHRRRSRSGS